MKLAGSETNPALLAARFLLREGRTYEQAVKQFSPYDRIQDPNPADRAAARTLVRRALNSKGLIRAFVLVNNRFEGSSPGTLNAIVNELEANS
jgi:hypothetical protein